MNPPKYSHLLASNSLPINIALHGNEYSFTHRSGGLASAISGFHREKNFCWVGSAGKTIPESLQKPITTDMLRQGFYPVYLTQEQKKYYYDRMCNFVIWPMFHYFMDRVSYSETAWKYYEDVNRVFATKIVQLASPDATIWIHDMQLMLLPALLREKRPDLKIGFFLHIPFPSSEIFRSLPHREDLLKGILGSDYVGFLTGDYVRHFRSAALRTLGIESSPNTIEYEGRRIGIQKHPIGINLKRFKQLLQSNTIQQSTSSIQSYSGEKKIILAVERLDYTKGIEYKLLAFERFLEKNPEYHGKVCFVQVVSPSRLQTLSYQSLKKQIDQLVSKINGKYSTLDYVPIHYVYKDIPHEELVALYTVADVGMITPIRDGMNLVAQEYVYCKTMHAEATNASHGMLVLSEFAGSAHSLAHGLLANPFDIENTSEVLKHALFMDEDEKKERMTKMAGQVENLNSTSWGEGFLAALERHASENRALLKANTPLNSTEEEKLFTKAKQSAHQLLFLDYDGTLTELQKTPEEAAPSKETLDLLKDLSKLPNAQIHLVSGRDRQVLEKWFGSLNIGISAEHGALYRNKDKQWIEKHNIDLSWMKPVHQALQKMVPEVPGSMIEEKAFALAWHYRQADPDYGTWRAHELLLSLREEFSHLPIEIINGNKVVEVRALGVHKGTYIKEMTKNHASNSMILCIGDDRTDYDMYNHLPEDATSIHVGTKHIHTTYFLPSPLAVRQFLRRLHQSLSCLQPKS